MSTFDQTVVTAQQVVVKTAYETFNLGVDFTNLLNGATLSSVNSVSVQQIDAGNTDEGDTAFAAGTGSPSGAIVTTQLSGGYNGARHLVRVNVTLSDGAIREGTVVVKIHNQ